MNNKIPEEEQRKFDELSKENKEFKIKDFFENENQEAALILITPNQVVKANVPEGQTHFDRLNNIFKLIYGKTNYIQGENFEEIAKNSKAICILLTPEYIPQLFYFPKEINERQYFELKNILQEMEKTKQELGKDIGYLGSINHANKPETLLIEAKGIEKLYVEGELPERILEGNYKEPYSGVNNDKEKGKML